MDIHASESNRETPVPSLPGGKKRQSARYALREDYSIFLTDYSDMYQLKGLVVNIIKTGVLAQFRCRLNDIVFLSHLRLKILQCSQDVLFRAEARIVRIVNKNIPGEHLIALEIMHTEYDRLWDDMERFLPA